MMCCQALAGKNNEMLAEVGKVRIETGQRIHRLETERLSQQDIYDKIAQKETELAGQSMSSSESILFRTSLPKSLCEIDACPPPLCLLLLLYQMYL